ncbi:MAG: M20/M25/M40 family metallo-hydrolase [bacterium]
MKKLESIFEELIKIPSTTGCEAMTVDYIEKYFKAIGWKTWQDTAGKVVGSSCGNLYAYYEVDPLLETVVLSAHTDTVLLEGQRVVPRKVGDKMISDGTTILGADNRAGITALLGVAVVLDKKKLKNNVLLFFPVHEEAGKMGSSQFKFSGKVKYVLNVDESMAPGNFVYSSLSHLSYKIEVKGKAAHAAKDYLKGVSAIVASAILISKLKLGGDREMGWTMNLGIIEGGKAINIIPDYVEIRGEVRAYKQGVLAIKLQEIRRAVVKTMGETNTKIELKLDEGDFVQPFEGKLGGKLQEICREGSKKLRLRAKFVRSFSSSDANSFASLGYETISVARGGSNPHSTRESFKIGDLNMTKNLLLEILYLS